MSSIALQARHHTAAFTRRLARFLLVLSVLGAVAVVVPSTPADAAMSAREQGLAGEFLAQLNAERAARGIAPLIVDASITPESVDWAESMVASQNLAHSGDPRAEIVAYGYGTGQITDAWMRSAGHRHLVTDANLGYAGVGVGCDSSGRMWAVVQFRRINTRLGTQTSSASSPTVTNPSSGAACDGPAPSLPQDKVNSIRRLYSAYFLRQPDKAGLDYWIQQATAGVTIPRISEHFAGSPEFSNRYGSLSNKDFVRMVYRNVMGREPDGGGQSYWMSELNRGLSRGWLMTYFSDSAEYRSKTGLG